MVTSMCGIAGFVDFDCRPEDAVNREQVLRSMAGRANCGDDVGVLRVSPNFASGMQRGRSTLSDQRHSRSGLSDIVLTGALYNEDELQSQIAAAGHSLNGADICETVRVAYDIWGLECFRRIDGAYSAAIWDARSQELILVRDAIGIQPLYYYSNGGVVCFGSTPKSILAHPSARAEVDIEGLRDVFTFVRAPGHAVFRGMLEVVPGTAVRIRRDSVKTYRYWSLEAREHRDDLRTTVMTVRALLEESVARRPSSASIQLSGGLDSCTILAVASAAARSERRGSLRTFSAKWGGQHFPSGAPADFNVEEANVIGMVQREQSVHADICVDVASLLDDNLRTATVNARDLPVGLGDMDVLYYLFYRGIRQHSTTITLSGEGADELFGGYSWFHDPKYVHANDFPFANINSYWGTGDASAAADLIAPDLLSRLDLQQYQHDVYRRAVAQVPKISERGSHEQRMWEVCHMHLTHWSPILLDRRDRVSRALGMEVHLPFCDQKLVEYVSNVPWHMKKFDNSTKSLLRAAAASYIPESVAYQGKSSWVANQPPGYDAALRKKLNRVLASRNAPVLHLLNHKLAKDLADDATAHPSISSHSIGGALRLNEWLSNYGVSVSGI